MRLGAGSEISPSVVEFRMTPNWSCANSPRKTAWAFRESRAVHSLLRSNEEGFDNLAKGMVELSRRSMRSIGKQLLGW
jgi:hypothetical protein